MTALSLAVTGALVVGLVWLVTWLIGYLQPLLVPLAVAAVLAYLLIPLVRKLAARANMPQKRAAVLVFIGFMAAGAVLIAAIAIPVSGQASKLAQSFPNLTVQFGDILNKNLSAAHLAEIREQYQDHRLLGPFVKWLPQPTAPSAPPDPPPQQPPGPLGPVPPADSPADSPADQPADLAPVGPTTYQAAFDVEALKRWAIDQLPVIGKRAWEFVRKSIGGFLGAFGFIIGFFLVPIYLFFFLRESTTISQNWSNYLPLRASKFKQEVVGTLTEINGYLAAFFRGQMLVSIIDGVITAVLLSLIGLKFGLLVGVLVGILGIIPYLGILACYIPAVIIATVQGAQAQAAWSARAEAIAAGTPASELPSPHNYWDLLGFIPIDASWWVLPLVVTIVFIAVNNLDGILIAPKIVGDSVGLHPFTVIFSVIFWSSLLGGLLGAILAVPLTASVKVLFQRYIWDRRLRRKISDDPDVPPADADSPHDEPAPDPA
ncbi:hypothetical protein BH23VER1_BH23VER1_15480 [soil metagenome]